jgi:hypothetical protein
MPGALEPSIDIDSVFVVSISRACTFTRGSHCGLQHLLIFQCLYSGSARHEAVENKSFPLSMMPILGSVR